MPLNTLEQGWYRRQDTGSTDQGGPQPQDDGEEEPVTQPDASAFSITSATLPPVSVLCFDSPNHRRPHTRNPGGVLVGEIGSMTMPAPVAE